ncbi:MAG TPA: cell wall hydrolase [Micropepsaceae bacterium]|jgi:spore germination cell wall hydrolase CwlJ-like protein|nr:cell wall hydrolase [Micropepsaceae bacterium]
MSQSGLFVLIAVLAAQAHQQSERTCMAQALYYEARSEGVRGEEAVAEVILRRLHDANRPDSVCGVVYEPHQFSFLDNGAVHGRLEPDAWAAANRLAARILTGEIVTAMTRRATHYHEVSVRPSWAKTLLKTARIGKHVFYKPRPPKSPGSIANSRGREGKPPTPLARTALNSPGRATGSGS